MIRIGPGRRPSRGASFLMAVILAVTFLVTVPSSLRAQDYLEVGEINTGRIVSNSDAEKVSVLCFPATFVITRS